MDAFICDAVRTPIGRFGGNLASMRSDDMAANVIRGLMARHPSLDPSRIDEVVFGCANQAGEDNRNVARMASLLAGLPAEVPASTINRLCASGMDAVVMAARGINVVPPLSYRKQIMRSAAASKYLTQPLAGDL